MSVPDSNSKLSNIPYTHRTAAANLLLSKARKLADLAELHFTDFALKDQRRVQQAISFYDMALLLTKPSDINYQTILNLKCLTLLEIGQFEDACKEYEYLVQVAHENEGPKVENATRDFARSQIEKYKDKKNHPLQPFEESEIRMLDDPSFCFWCEQFCDLLSKGKFTHAQQCFSSALQDEISPKMLKEKWRTLLANPEAGVDINLENYRVATEEDEDRYIGWCYLTVLGNETNEAISMDVYQSEGHGFEIRSIEIGRP